MGMRFQREKRRHWLSSLAYKLNRFIPLSNARKLDFVLDLEWIAHRLARENAARVGITNRRGPPFLIDQIKPGDRVLDLGCADGQILASAKARQVVGIDHNAAAIAVARAEFPDREFICADAVEYLENAEAFDVLVMSHILEHLTEPEPFLRSIKDRFERIYVEVPDFEWSPSNEFRVKRNRTLLYMDNDHVAEFDRNEIEQLFARVDLCVLDREFRQGVMRYWLAHGSSSYR